jgi:hypothetical protein
MGAEAIAGRRMRIDELGERRPREEGGRQDQEEGGKGKTADEADGLGHDETSIYFTQCLSARVS